MKNLKACKKSYSVLIQNILYRAINDNKIDCFNLYINKIKEIEVQNNPRDFLYNDIDEEIPEENEINYNNTKKNYR